MPKENCHVGAASGSETGPLHIFRLDCVSSIEEAERIAGFKARRPTRGTFHSVAVGLVFGFPMIAVAHHVGPGPRDLDTVTTERIYGVADRPPGAGKMR